MINPLYALLIGLAFLGLTAALFWPERGFYWQLQRRRELTEKVLIEDTLKYIYKCERNQQTASLDSLAGALSITPEHALEILALTQTRGLLNMRENQFQLTEAGKKTATQIVRAHRLWERYLADSTGYLESEWHQQAERLEHRLSEEELDRLAARLGHPSHDPHGDPIPTRRGDLIPHQGIPVSDLSPGTIARIVHIEDEPEVIYAQIVAEELHPQMILEVEEVTPSRIKFWVDDQEHILAPIVAANISVRPLNGETQLETLAGVPLDTLQPGQSGIVTGISPLSRGVERRRLLDLGVIPGTKIAVELVNPSGDPTAYLIRGTVIALRSRQARLIQVLPVEEDQRTSPRTQVRLSEKEEDYG